MHSAGRDRSCAYKQETKRSINTTHWIWIHNAVCLTGNYREKTSLMCQWWWLCLYSYTDHVCRHKLLQKSLQLLNENPPSRFRRFRAKGRLISLKTYFLGNMFPLSSHCLLATSHAPLVGGTKTAPERGRDLSLLLCSVETIVIPAIHHGRTNY